jgi:hypothetical protein
MADDTNKNQTKTLSEIQKQADQDKLRNSKQDLSNKLAESSLKISQLREKGENIAADKMQSLLDLVVKNSERSNSVIDNRLAELNSLNAQIATKLDLAESAESIRDKRKEDSDKKLADIQAKMLATRKDPLEELTNIIKQDTDINKKQLDASEALKKITGTFGYSATEQSKELKAAFEKEQKLLLDAIEKGDEKQIQESLAMIDAIKEGAESEENRREAQAAQDEANSHLAKLGTGISGVGDKLDSFGKSALAGGGILAGLAGIALMFVDPKKFAEVVGTLVNNVSEVFKGIIEIFTGDGSPGTGADRLKENLGTVGAMISGLALMFGGTVVKALGSLITKARTLFIALNAFRIFMMGTFIPSMMAGFSGMMAAMAPVLAAMAPILLPILAIAAVFGLIVLALTKIRDALGFTSVFDVLMLGLAHMKDAFGHIVNTIGSIVNFILGIVEKFGRFLGFKVDIPEIPKMDTDNAAKKKVELQEKAQAKAESDALEKANLNIPSNILIDPSNTGGVMADLQNDNFDMKQNGVNANSIVTAVTQQNTANNSSSTTTIVNPTGNSMASMELASATGGRR